MTLLERIKSIFKKDERLKEMLEERRMQRIAEQRDKNSNERELERYYEEERQKQIKLQLEAFRKQKQREFWSENKNWHNKNIMVGHKKILTNDNHMFSIKSDNLVGGNMFWR